MCNVPRRASQVPGPEKVRELRHLDRRMRWQFPLAFVLYVAFMFGLRSEWSNGGNPEAQFTTATESCEAAAF
jgi:hypothetical protein